MENLFQSSAWEEFKLKTGYSKSFWIDSVLILKKALPLGRSMLYSPMTDKNLEVRIENLEFIKKVITIAKEENAIFYRLELDIEDRSDNGTMGQINYLRNFSFRKSFEEMQPEHTLVLDISKPEEEILEGMKQKGRYNIKLSEKANLTIKRELTADSFYKLYAETAKRHKITYRDKAYFDNLIEILGKIGYASVYTAYLDVTALSSAIIVYSGEKAIYLFGSSSADHRELMAPYLVHWQAIKDSKNKGCKEYDFFGIAPTDNPKHPWAGITRFKKQFGGSELKILGSFDLLFKPLEYKAFKLAEKIRRR